jgi:hypothetical protein
MQVRDLYNDPNTVKKREKKKKDLYNENHKTLKKGTEDTRRWKILPCSSKTPMFINQQNIVKMATLLNAIYRINAITIKIPITIIFHFLFLFHKNRKINPKIHIEVQKTLNSQSNPEQKDQHWKYHNT